jgi:hypothetical protein
MADDDIQVRLEGEDAGQAAQESPKPDASAQSAAAEAERARQEAAYWRAVRDSERLQNAELTVASAAKSIKADLRQAVESGDVDGLDEALDRKMQVALSRQLLEAQKQQLHQPPPPPADPVERYVQGRPAQTQQWLREHREYVTDPAKNAELTRAHYSALGAGHNPDTPGYFAAVEKKIGLRQERESGGGVSYQRNIPGFNPSDPSTHIQGNRVVLTKGEAERATNGDIVWNEADYRAGRIKDRSMIGRPIQIQEYARRKKIMLADGMYNRIG